MKSTVNDQRGGKKRRAAQSISEVVWLVGLISPFVTEPGKRNYLPVTVPSLMSQFTSGAGFFSSLSAISLPFASVQDKSMSGSWEGGVFILCVPSLQVSLQTAGRLEWQCTAGLRSWARASGCRSPFQPRNILCSQPVLGSAKTLSLERNQTPIPRVQPAWGAAQGLLPLFAAFCFSTQKWKGPGCSSFLLALGDTLQTQGLNLIPAKGEKTKPPWVESLSWWNVFCATIHDLKFKFWF